MNKYPRTILFGIALLAFGTTACAGATPVKMAAAGVAVPTAPAVVSNSALRVQFLAAAAPVVTASTIMQNGLNALGSNPSMSQLTAITGPESASFQTFDGALLAIPWPAAILPDARAVVAADAQLEGDLSGTGALDLFTASTWEVAVAKDTDIMKSALNVLRSDIGLPPVS